MGVARGIGYASSEACIQEEDQKASQLLAEPENIIDLGESLHLSQSTEESEEDYGHHLRLLHEHMDSLDQGSLNLTLKSKSGEEHAHHLHKLHDHMDTLDMSSLNTSLKERGC